MESDLLSKAIYVKLPVCSFTPTLHPHYEAIKAACDPWILAFTAPASKAASEFWIGSAFPLFCSLVYARCATERVIPLVKLITWFFASDSDDDDPTVRGCDTDHVLRRHELILECFAGKPLPPASQPADVGVEFHNIIKGLPSLHDIWRDISPDIPFKMLSRYLNAMRDYLNANVLQAHYRKLGRLPGVNEYIGALRRPTSLLMPFLILMEYALGIELDDETLGSETMMRLLDAVTDHVALVNDVFSCAVEKCYGDHVNLPNVILQERGTGFTFAEAMEEALGIVEEADKQCVQLLKEVENSRVIEKPGVPAFLHGLKLWMAGNIEWSLKTARYSHTCSAEGLVVSLHA